MFAAHNALALILMAISPVAFIALSIIGIKQVLRRAPGIAVSRNRVFRRSHQRPILDACFCTPAKVRSEQFGKDATPPVGKGRWELPSTQGLLTCPQRGRGRAAARTVSGQTLRTGPLWLGQILATAWCSKKLRRRPRTTTFPEARCWNRSRWLRPALHWLVRNLLTVTSCDFMADPVIVQTGIPV
jgi:hypothetical protein